MVPALEALLEPGAVDAVYIATPLTEHAAFATGPDRPSVRERRRRKGERLWNLGEGFDVGR